MGKNHGKESTFGAENHNSEDGYLLTALEQLYFKLVAAQPEYMEEDVMMAYSSPCGSPTRPPGTLCCGWDADWDHSEPLWTARGDGTVTNDKRGGSVATSSSPGQSVPSSQTVVVDLDRQLTSYEFLLTVRNFEVENVLKSRKAVIDVLKLVNHGYALTWRDTRHIRSAASSRPTTTARRENGGRGNTAVSMTARRSVFAPSLSFSIPTYRPPQKLVKLMGKCVESLLVYANESPSLRTMVTSNVAFLRMLCFVCVESGKLESSFRDNRCRDVNEELNELVSHWQTFSVTLPLLGALKECYLLEFLLDAALPPAVCSSRFDGIVTVLLEKKERLIAEMISSRTGFGIMTKGLPLRGLAALVSMSMFAEPKLRARVLDRMTGEGLVRTLLDELTDIVKEGVRLVRLMNGGRLSSSRSRSVSSSPVRARSKKAVGPVLTSSLRLNQVGSEEKVFFGSKDSLVRRLGYCLDILQCLTAPNLSLDGASFKATKGLARATAWASQTEDLQGICFCLLRLAPILHYDSTRYLFLHYLQEQAMNCVQQIASYSAVLYSTVVETLDGIFYEYCRGRKSGEGDIASSLLPLVLELLRLKQHAEANEECVGRWFMWLTECLVPQAFDVPVLTCNMTSNRRLYPRRATRRLSNSRCEAPILARNLRRDEILSLSPYFYFASHLISETTWRCGAEPFLARIALLAYHVLLTQARRPNLIFGQASSCYDAVAPLLETSCGIIPGELTAGNCESLVTPVRPSGKTSSGLLPLGRKRCRSTLQEDVDGEEEVFVPSPSSSPVFLGAYSPSALEVENNRESDECSRAEGSTCCSTSTPLWRGRFSTSAFLAALGKFFSD